MIGPNTRRGFTLIELLIVIAIISILAAILFPVFATARDKARQSACMSNGKQLGIGFMQYSSDYDEMLPIGNRSAGCNPSAQTGDCREGFGWPGTIYPYVKSKGVYACPNDTVASFTGSDVLSYTYNFNIPQVYTWIAGMTRAVGPYLSKFSAPSKTVLLFESSVPTASGWTVDVTDPLNAASALGNGTGNTGNLAYATGYTGQNGTSPPATYVACPSPVTGSCYFNTPRHLGGAIYVFADGHAKWLPPTAVSIGYPSASGAVGDIPATSTYSQAASPVAAGMGASGLPFTATFGIQ